MTGASGQVSYEWAADGQATSATAASILWRNATAGSHRVSVTATDSLGNQGSASRGFSVAGKDLQIEFPLLLLNGEPLKRGETRTITLNEKNRQVELQLACEDLTTAFIIAVLTWSPNDKNESFSTLIDSLFLDDGAPNALCDFIGPLSNGMRAQADQSIPLQTSPPLTVGANLASGGVEVDLQQDGVTLQVETHTATVIGSDQDTFNVFYNLDTKETVVVANQGAINVQPNTDGASPVNLQAGQQVTVDSDGSGPITRVDQPPLDDLTIPEALDANNNNLLDDAEVRQAVQYWITDQPVPGSGGKTIDDDTMRRLVQMWILGQSVSAAAASVQPLAQVLR